MIQEYEFGQLREFLPRRHYHRDGGSAFGGLIADVQTHDGEDVPFIPHVGGPMTVDRCAICGSRLEADISNVCEICVGGSVVADKE